MTADTHTIDLEEGDCCLIIRKDGTVESLIPNLSDDEVVPNTVMLITACAAAVMQPKMAEYLIDNLVHMMLVPDLEDFPVD